MATTDRAARATHAAIDGAAAVGGTLLRAATGAVGLLRPAEKPLHPVGTVWEADLIRHGGDGRHSGVAWLDEPGTEPAVVRISAAIGLPHGWPDIPGIALRTYGESGEETGDVLFATTGRGSLSRFVLLPARSAADRMHSTLLPYRGPKGALVLAAVPVGGDRIELSWARLTGEWVGFATIALRSPSDLEPSFDPVLHHPPGLELYPWITRLREPAYRRARTQRGEAG